MNERYYDDPLSPPQVTSGGISPKVEPSSLKNEPVESTMMVDPEESKDYSKLSSEGCGLQQPSKVPSSEVKLETIIPEDSTDRRNDELWYTNGDYYIGDIVDRKRHGTGTLHFADQSEYVGDWVDNVQHGFGTRRWKNGDCYCGQYYQGKRTGEGQFYFSNGDTFTGQFRDGLMHGFGRYYYKSGQRFEGNFVNGKRHGKGKLQRKDGYLDVGVYKHDVRFGVGVRWSPDRTRAWKMQNGAVVGPIMVHDAVALDYEMDETAQTLGVSGDRKRSG